MGKGGEMEGERGLPNEFVGRSGMEFTNQEKPTLRSRSILLAPPRTQRAEKRSAILKKELSCSHLYR